jgi:hypothetical protein
LFHIVHLVKIVHSLRCRSFRPQCALQDRLPFLFVLAKHHINPFNINHYNHHHVVVVAASHGQVAVGAANSAGKVVPFLMS